MIPPGGNGPSVPGLVYEPPIAMKMPTRSATTARQFQPRA